MGLLDFLRKDVGIFPPHMRSSWMRIRYLQYSESFNSLLVCMIFVNYVFFCGIRNEEDIFRLINVAISVFICGDVVLKILLIPSLYLNKHYYGQMFIIFDLLSGPLSFTMNVVSLMENDRQEVTYADILILFRIFCMEKIRLLIKDVIHILYVARYILLSLYLTFYVFSYFAYRVFQGVSPQYFRNVYISMLSMMQVLTLDSWNQQINQSVSVHYGQIWSCFFIFFIIFMFFYFINLLLGAFVSYYSSPDLRVNFEYHFDHDDQLNPYLIEEHQRTIEISKALKLLNLEQDQQAQNDWGLGRRHQCVVLTYTAVQMILEVVRCKQDNEQLTMIYFASEQIFGSYFIYAFAKKVKEFKEFRSSRSEQYSEEQTIRLYVLALLLIAGPIAKAIDLITAAQFGLLAVSMGPGVRVLVILAVDCVQVAVLKFVEVLPGVYHIITFVAGLLFTLSLIGHHYLQHLNVEIGQPIFESVTSTYLFLLQTITFDSWADVARVVIKNEGFLFVIYFIFLTIVIGFFLMNMLVGITATLTQPKTKLLFEHEHTLKQRVDKVAVRQLQDIVNEEPQDVSELKAMLDEFNASQDPDDKLFVHIGGKQYTITTKNFIILEDEQ